MSSCLSECDEQQEELRQKIYKAAVSRFRNAVMQAALFFLSSKEIFIDAAFKVDRKQAIIEALEDVILILKENADVKQIRKELTKRSESGVSGIPDSKI